MNIFVFKIFLLQYLITNALFQNVQGKKSSTSYTCKNISPRSCKNTEYRTIDGSCNNLHKPEWGASGTPFGRFMPNNYGDGLSSMPLSKTGKQLPLARKLSFTLFPDKLIFDETYNLNAMQWGQVIAHDLGFSQTLDVTTESRPTTCCRNGTLANVTSNSECAPILIPYGDPVYGGEECISFVRHTTSKDVGCTPTDVPAKQLNGASSFMDLSLIYGNTLDRAAELREGKGGRLRTTQQNNQQWPPNDANGTCPFFATTKTCFMSGDIRVNQNIHLAMLHVFLIREHNHIVKYLARVNSHWNDETLYQTGRRILNAVYQCITYNEYFPIILGYKNMVEGKLIYPDAEGFVNDYRPDVDPSVLDEYTTAAFRNSHTLIVGELEFINNDRRLNGSMRLSDGFTRPEILYDKVTELAIGITTQAMGALDQYFTKEVTSYLFKANKKLGQDLRAIDIQRGRDHGLRSYNDARAVCGLPVAKTFDDMKDNISSENVEKLKKLYESPNDVDLSVAGALEHKVPGTQNGPTFLCIIREQLRRTRIGDRFFFENGVDSIFTTEQLKTIKKGCSMARLICDNVDGVTKMQREAFKKVSSSNKLVPCEELPAVNLDLWKDSSNTCSRKSSIIDIFKPRLNLIADFWL